MNYNSVPGVSMAAIGVSNHERHVGDQDNHLIGQPGMMQYSAPDFPKVLVGLSNISCVHCLQILGTRAAPPYKGVILKQHLLTPSVAMFTSQKLLHPVQLPKSMMRRDQISRSAKSLALISGCKTMGSL